MVNYYSKIFGKTIEQKIPFIIHWELTYRCNLKCQHCYVIPEDGKQELDTRKVKEILSALARANALFLIWSGGEVLCREDFLEIIRFAYKLGFAQRIFTNGTRLSKEIIKEIKKIHPLSVEVSLYGIKSSTHDKITQVEGSFDKTFKALFRLKEENINIALKCMVLKENLGEFKEVEKLSQNLEAKFIYDFNIAPRRDGSLVPIEKRLTGKDLEEFIRSRPMNLECLSSQSTNSLFCNAGVNNFAISPGGEVFPCVGIREKIGNILEDSIDKLQRAPLLEKLRKRKISFLSDCQGCLLIPYCSRCYGIAQMEDGNLWGKSSRACEVAEIVKKVTEERLKEKEVA